MRLKYILLTILFLTDRLIKYFVLNSGKYTFNKGFALGILNNLNEYFAIFVPLGIIFVFGYLGLKHWKKLGDFSKLAMLSIILGSGSNLMDRIMYNGVIDYIRLQWLPVFNIADVMIVVGLLYLLIIEYGKKDNKAKS